MSDERRTSADIEIRQQMRKSNVRIVVTYFVVGIYCLAATIITLHLLKKAEYDLAIAVFNGLASLAAGIAGFWFGSRGSGFPEEGKQSSTPGDAATAAGAPQGTP